MSFSSTTGYVSWDTNETTDLDYSPMPLITRASNSSSETVFCRPMGVRYRLIART